MDSYKLAKYPYLLPYVKLVLSLLYVKCKEICGMPKISAKGQITLPASQREAIGVRPGDEIETFVVDDQINIVKKVAGAARGVLKNVKAKVSISDEQSMESFLS
ncbi:AbrB/MazE/SpoVT family DNA-binding domain-containing protein [Zhongshania sp. BJYM1]|uniref:AbrB/MazE/SpoVT family DNA-binding domain-containing protein n=1 Tax=Zhongshania aquatica TaxID=2965069 RepID=UPI0022B5C821|nr:AbrB/MazE/SpoVT family DNA-binding domain-containing protein [Marortus sp. BJYM1]